MAIVLHLLFLIVNVVILHNYRMVNYDSIFNLSSGVTCNCCIKPDARQSLALRVVIKEGFHCITDIILWERPTW